MTASGDGTAPLSDAQKQIWLLSQLAPDAVCNECYTVGLPQALDLGALRRSLTAIVQRHSVWRTRFTIVGGEPQQIVDAPVPFELPFVDLRPLAPEARNAELERITSAEATRPFDLARGPLVRATAISLGDTEHKLFMTVHQMVVDGATFYNVFLPELAQLYAANCRSAPLTLRDLPAQYADYARWQVEQPRITPEERVRDWEQRPSGDLPHLELPLDRPRPARLTFRGGRVQAVMPATFRQRIAAAAAAEGTTPFVLLLAAFIAHLHGLTGQDDLLVGVPAAIAKPGVCERLIGLFTNIVPVRIDASGDPSFRTLIRRVRDAVLDSARFADAPFEPVAEEVGPSPDGTQNPRLQVVFSLQQAPPQVVPAHGFSVVPLEADSRAAKQEIALLLDERHVPDVPGECAVALGATLQFNADLFEASTMARRLEEFESITTQLIDRPGGRLSEVEVITAAQRQMVVNKWNATATPYPRETPVHHLFEAQVLRTPHATALSGAGASVSYRELDERATRLARVLQHSGVTAGNHVAVLMGRSVSFVVSILAILKAGGVYVPLDPAAPADRLSMMLADAGAAVLITGADAIDPGLAPGMTIVRIDADGEAGVTATNAVSSAATVEGRSAASISSDVACVLFTSGSTGRPKGVAVAHRGIARLVTNPAYIVLSAGDRIAHLSNVCFDASTFEIWGALTAGAELVIIPAEQVLSPRALADTIAGERITTIFLTTSLFNLVALERPSAFAALRDVLFGGEAADAEAVRRVVMGGPPRRLVNVYGPTEATTFASWYEVDKAGTFNGTVPIGRPIANTTLYVLDRRLRPTPVGVPGELFIGGDGVALGYVNRPDLTAERFVPDPFSTTPGARLYRTGDVVRYRADGVMEFIGRVDNQIKIRGFRIEPGEIECALSRHPDVTGCVVVAQTSPDGGKQLVAYASLAPHADRDNVGTAMRAFLKQTLPDYMIPPVFVVVDEWPLTPTGKIDRRALPPPRVEAVPGKTVSAAGDLREAALVTLWEQLLHVSPIGIDDNFFDLGGHSLLAARMVDEIERRFGCRLPLAALFHDPTIRSVARHLSEGAPAGDNGPVVALRTRGAQAPIFFFHGDFTGGGFFCRHLAAAAGDRPFFVVQPHGIEGRRIPRSVEQMAEERIEALRREQPHGPYVVGGYCNGATVAIEVAHRLAAAGETIERLILIDPPPMADRWFQRIRTVAAGMSVNPNRVGEWYCRIEDFRALPLASKWRVLLRRAARLSRSALSSAPAPDIAAAPYDPSGDYWCAIRTYVPPPLPAPVAVITSADQTAFVDRTWIGHSGSVQVLATPGDHTTCITTHASVLAQRFRVCLERATGAVRQCEEMMV